MTIPEDLTAYGPPEDKDYADFEFWRDEWTTETCVDEIDWCFLCSQVHWARPYEHAPFKRSDAREHFDSFHLHDWRLDS